MNKFKIANSIFAGVIISTSIKQNHSFLNTKENQ